MVKCSQTLTRIRITQNKNLLLNGFIIGRKQLKINTKKAVFSFSKGIYSVKFNLNSADSGDIIMTMPLPKDTIPTDEHLLLGPICTI